MSFLIFTTPRLLSIKRGYVKWTYSYNAAGWYIIDVSPYLYCNVLLIYTISHPTFASCAALILPVQNSNDVSAIHLQLCYAVHASSYWKQQSYQWLQLYWKLAFISILETYGHTVYVLCPSPTVPNLYLNVHECKKFEIRAHSCWGEHESCKFFIWARLFLDNSKITVRHVRSQLEKVRFIYANEHKSACKVTRTSRIWVR